MMLAQCKSVVFFSPRRVVLLGKLLVPCDAPHALGVDHVALALDERVLVRGAAQTAQLMVSCDAPHALFVDHVALALYERVFAQIAQLVVPCDAPHALLVDHVALALDERVFAQIAIPHVADGGWGCRAAHHRGEQNIRGDVIWRPRHVDPHIPGHPARQIIQIWI